MGVGYAIVVKDAMLGGSLRAREAMEEGPGSRFFKFVSIFEGKAAY